MYSHKALSIHLFLGIEINIQLRNKFSLFLLHPHNPQTTHRSFPVPKATCSLWKSFIKQRKSCSDRSPDGLANRGSMFKGLLYCFGIPCGQTSGLLRQLLHGHSIQPSLSFSIRLALNKVIWWLTGCSGGSQRQWPYKLLQTMMFPSRN